MNNQLYRENKALWREIIANKGMDYCFRCGYNKHFGAIDFHHKEGNKKEQVRICLVFTLRPNAERIKELEKCIPLCAACHRELHIEDKSVGQPVKDMDEVEAASQMTMEFN